MTRVRLLLLIAGTLVPLSPAAALAAAKPYCRDLVFSGAAGAGSNDIVTLRIVDQAGNTLDESCQLQVHNNETARAFAARITGAWGDGTGASCTEPVPLPKKTCGNAAFGGRSCNHKFKFKGDKTTIDPDDGLIRIRVCCKDTPSCKGTNLTNSPISVQNKKAPAVVFGPAVPPVVGIDIASVSVDPIGMTQQPPAALQSCRKDLGKAIGGAVSPLMGALVKCRDLEIATGPGPDCTTLDGDSKVMEADQKLHLQLGAVVAASCAPSGSPVDFGYASCPVPCSENLINGWPDVAECLACVTETRILEAVNQAYGVPGPVFPVTLEAEDCQSAVGRALEDVVRTDIREIVKCQKGSDAGTQGLPLGTRCRDADLKGKREAVADKAATSIFLDCSGGELSDELTSCGIDASAEVACIVLGIGPATSRAIADAVFPEGASSPSGAFLEVP